MTRKFRDLSGRDGMGPLTQFVCLVSRRASGGLRSRRDIFRKAHETRRYLNFPEAGTRRLVAASSWGPADNLAKRHASGLQ